MNLKTVNPFREIKYTVKSMSGVKTRLKIMLTLKVIFKICINIIDGILAKLVLKIFATHLFVCKEVGILLISSFFPHLKIS